MSHIIVEKTLSPIKFVLEVQAGAGSDYVDLGYDINDVEEPNFLEVGSKMEFKNSEAKFEVDVITVDVKCVELRLRIIA